MFRFVKKYFFPAFLLFFIFSEPLFNCFMAVAGIDVQGGQMQLLYIGIFAIAMLVFLSDIRKSMWGYNNVRVLGPMVAVIVLYWMTQYLYKEPAPDLYISQFLSFGVRCVPAAIIGIHFMKNPCFMRMDRLLPFFLLPVGLIIGTIGFGSAMMDEFVRSEDGEGGGLNYQTVSYYMAEFYSLCAYFIFFSSIRGTRFHKVVRWAMGGAMLFFAAICTMSGGRGAMAFMIAVSGYIVYLLYKSKRMSKGMITLIITVIAGLFALIFVKLDIMNSAGLSRVIDKMGSDNERINLWTTAFESFLRSPILGHGLGSVWWEVGYFSHDIFMDILVEAGLAGLFLLLFAMVRVYGRMFRLCKANSAFLFFMFLLIKESMLSLVSGYWMSASVLWMSFCMTNVINKKRYFSILRQCRLIYRK
ncbi:MAG: O-antigen ligase family protein [Bacteroidales bacterium]|nr:O-antigen ligase family protein [Bacteroidales bacterium]